MLIFVVAFIIILFIFVCLFVCFSIPYCCVYILHEYVWSCRCCLYVNCAVCKQFAWNQSGSIYFFDVCMCCMYMCMYIYVTTLLGCYGRIEIQYCCYMFVCMHIFLFFTESVANHTRGINSPSKSPYIGWT